VARATLWPPSSRTWVVVLGNQLNTILLTETMEQRESEIKKEVTAMFGDMAVPLRSFPSIRSAFGHAQCMLLIKHITEMRLADAKYIPTAPPIAPDVHNALLAHGYSLYVAEESRRCVYIFAPNVDGAVLLLSEMHPNERFVVLAVTGNF